MHGRRGRRGFTLLELLLVMALLAVVLGAGAGMFAALDLGRRQAEGLVKNVLRTAQNSAIARRAPARVRLEPGGRAITAESLAVIGTWHFEGRRLEGAPPHPGGLRGAVDYTERGFLGDALLFDGRRGSYAEIHVQDDPAFDVRDGFAIECAVRRESAGGGRLLSLGAACGLEITGVGAASGWLVPAVVQDGVERPGGRVLVESPPGAVPRGEWVRLRLEYDRAHLRLLVDGVEVARMEEGFPVWRVEEPLVLSDRRFPFGGALDSLVISAVAASEENGLPESVAFTDDSPREVVFDAGGGLDRRRHREPARIGIRYEDGTVRTVVVGIYGTVDA